jgi:phage protein D/phage baseplate assembly protein gpV
MSESNTIASQVTIRLNGQEVQPPVMAHLASLTVDQHSHLPDMFTARFYDTQLELLDQGPFDLTQEIEILAQKTDSETVTLFKGEITALEPEFGEGMVAQFVIRGFDRLHRLYRETRSRAYVNVKDSDLAAQIAREANLQAQIDTTSTVYEHVFQHNQTDLAFLAQRAQRIGYECFIDAGKLFFRKPPQTPASSTLTWGSDLLSFHPHMTLAEQVDEVLVRGWDVEKQKPIVGRAQQGQRYPKIQEAKDGAGWAKKFGRGRLILVDQPVTTQAEADGLAAARLDELSGAFVEAEGIALKRPEIKAGQAIRLEALGQRFSGTYLVTSATHSYTAEGLQTIFRVTGARSGLLSEQMQGGPAPSRRLTGVVTAVVTNSDDPTGAGRVKVKYPWLAEDVESNWVRVMGIGAGPHAGLAAIPDVGDEVLVAFEQGDFDHPFILGGVWNGQSPLPDETGAAKSGEKPLVRTWRSRKGHSLTLMDTDDKKIEIRSADGRVVIIDDKNKKITVKTSGVEISVEDNKLAIKCQGEVSIKSASNLKLEADGNLEIKASGQVTVKGAVINLN